MTRILVIVSACAAGVLLPLGVQPILDGDAWRGAPDLALGLAAFAVATLCDRRLQRRGGRSVRS